MADQSTLNADIFLSPARSLTLSHTQQLTSENPAEISYKIRIIHTIQYSTSYYFITSFRESVTMLSNQILYLPH
jgi:hypothetical protein